MVVEIKGPEGDLASISTIILGSGSIGTIFREQKDVGAWGSGSMGTIFGGAGSIGTNFRPFFGPVLLLVNGLRFGYSR